MPPAESELAVVVARLEDLRTDVANLRQEIKDQNVTYLPRAEFEAWRTGIGREIGDMKTGIANAVKESAPKRVSPWVVVGAVGGILMVLVATSTLVITLIDKLAN